MKEKFELALSYLAKLEIPLLPFDELDERGVPVDLHTEIVFEYAHKEGKWFAEATVNSREKAHTELHKTPEEALESLLYLLACKVSNGE